MSHRAHSQGDHSELSCEYDEKPEPESDLDKMGFFERMKYNWKHRHDEEPKEDRTPSRRMSDHFSDGSLFEP